MRAYLITTGVLFALVAVAHVWRVVAESSALATDPWFVALTILAVVMSAWAFRLLPTVQGGAKSE
jgi:hypothetical protein